MKIIFQMSEKNYIIELIEGRCEDPKARIFKAALEEFGMRSLAGARTREIAAKANLNHAAINYYFGAKTSCTWSSPSKSAIS